MADIYVPSQYPTIQEAINASSNGDTIWVADGTYTGANNKNLNWDGSVKHITVRSENGATIASLIAKILEGRFILITQAKIVMILLWVSPLGMGILMMMVVESPAIIIPLHPSQTA